MKATWILIAVVNVVAVAFTIVILATGLGMGLVKEDAEAVGGTLTLILVLLALAAQMKARAGKIPSPLMALVALPGPIYAYLGGALNHVIGYHVIAIFVHGLVVFTVKRARARAKGKGEES